MHFFIPSSAWALRLFLFWILLISVLFFLPGSALPSNDWLGRIQFDKWVHVGLFGVLVWLLSAWQAPPSGKKMWQIYGSALLYGLFVEIIQDQLVVNRSFDGWDLLADAAGSAGGLILFKRSYKVLGKGRKK